ncbi:unnamed protein product [Paramecium sonneborni]|uniref:Armadillo-type fold n=1 Tax=Paramecium sonneborni TaxID=65129 RepID=A0A8S1RA90_9CILI|nr:unnamed protein product [Paramecium sonneborni]
MIFVLKLSFSWFFKRDTTFDLHFDNEDLQLTTLLDDDNLICEAQYENKKIFDFIQKDHILELIKYITQMPEDDSNSKRAYRYPFYSSKLLNCIGKYKPEFFVQDDKFFLYKIFNFFQQDQDVNSVLVAYVVDLLQQISIEIVVNEFFENQNIQQGMIRQLQSRSVSDFLVYLLQEKIFDESKYKNKKINLLQNILRRLDDSTNFEISSNISYIIQEMIKERDHPQWYIDIFFGEFIENLCKQIIKKNNYLSLQSSRILFNLLFYIEENKKNEQYRKEFSIVIDTDIVFSKIVTYVGDWIDFLLFQNSHILGEQKLKILEIIGVGVSLKNESFINKLYKSNIFKVYNQLFITYEQHDILHFQYYNLINKIIENQIDILIKNLFEENNFIELLIQCTKLEKNNEIQRKGQLGFITLLGTFIEEQVEKYQYLKQLVETEQWEQFRNQYFEKAKKINSFELGQEGIEELLNNKDNLQEEEQQYQDNNKMNEKKESD